jgi:hypothetical protein
VVALAKSSPRVTSTRSLLTKLNACAACWGWREEVIKHKTAIFRQINKDWVAAHHDALEFPDGQIVLLTLLAEGRYGPSVTGGAKDCH